MRTSDGGRSRVTGLLRLAVAMWLIISAFITFTDPLTALAESPAPETVQPIAALSFCLGLFLLTGFMSRVAGVLLFALGIWQSLNLGATTEAVMQMVVGVYLAVRGGGAWAMDIYVQKMQDRVRRREALERSAHANGSHPGLD